MAEIRYVVAVRLQGGTEDQHIAELIWVRPNYRSFKGNRETVISKIEDDGFLFKVTDGTNTADVKVVTSKSGKYLRSEKDGKRTDNLLSLPKF